MPPRRSAELDVPAEPRPVEEPPSNVLDFSAPPRLPFAISPIAVLLMALLQRERATRKAVARHQRRKNRRDTTTWADLRSRGTGS